jgi:hypothetical protein
MGVKMRRVERARAAVFCAKTNAVRARGMEAPD